MKKLTALLLAVITAVTLISCAADEPAKTAEPTASVTSVPTTEPEDTEPAPAHEPGEFYALYLKENAEISFDKAPKAMIDIYKWGDEYAPAAYAQMVFREGDGFYVRMHCDEPGPKVTFTEFSDDVYLDSCLEFFADYVPNDDDERYVNIEMNAAGAFFASWSSGIGQYSETDMLKDAIKVEPLKESDGWNVTVHVTLETLAKLYPGASWTEGSVIKCNFYKCGSGCVIPHYGVWSEIDLKNPNFHTPEFFKEVKISR